jgi:hypothetical protein
MFNTVTQLITTEGLSLLGSRVAGSYFFEISAAMDAWNNPSLSRVDKGYAYGRALSVILNYTI